MILFAFHGRADRKEYFLHVLGGTLLYLAVVLVLYMVSADPRQPQSAMTFVAAVYFTLLFVIVIDEVGVTLRRLEDLGRPRFHFFFLLVPFYNLYLELILLFRRGVAARESDPG